tara:strand:+ start:5855 stop:6718 length:864 start_codon:yes stop_codon:yes gene_type:complete
MRKLFRSRQSDVFFIRGYAKSGTNWLCNLMNLHPQIACTGEFHLRPLFESVRAIQSAPWGILSREKQSVFLEDAFYRMVKQLIRDVCGNKRWCGDRTPCSLRSTFVPGVRQLYITRDGRDAVVSWAYHTLNYNFNAGPRMQENLQRFKADPNYFEQHKQELLACETVVREFASQWNAAIVDDFQMMQSADRAEIDLPYYWIRYEDLQTDTLKYRNEIYQFLGLAAAKASPLNALTEPGFGSADTNRPNDFYRRGRAGTWQEYFTAEQLAWFNDEASEALRLISKNAS